MFGPRAKHRIVPKNARTLFKEYLRYQKYNTYVPLLLRVNRRNILGVTHTHTVDVPTLPQMSKSRNRILSTLLSDPFLIFYNLLKLSFSLNTLMSLPYSVTHEMFSSFGYISVIFEPIWTFFTVCYLEFDDITIYDSFMAYFRVFRGDFEF